MWFTISRRRDVINHASSMVLNYTSSIFKITPSSMVLNHAFFNGSKPRLFNILNHASSMDLNHASSIVLDHASSVFLDHTSSML